jgi:hypothetical protein
MAKSNAPLPGLRRSMPRLTSKLTLPKIVLMVLAISAVVGLCFFFSNNLNRISTFSDIGYEKDGYYFSVPAGQDRRSALRTLSNNPELALTDSRTGTNCLTRRYDREMDFDIFADDSWRRGTVCVVSSGGVVSEVVWYFNFLAP